MLFLLLLLLLLLLFDELDWLAADLVLGGEGFGVELGLDEFTLPISAELVDINVSLPGELAELLLHSLAELHSWHIL